MRHHLPKPIFDNVLGDCADSSRPRRLTPSHRLLYTANMSTTITIRAESSLRDALEKRAAETGRSLSAVVRQILVDALTERPMEGRVGHVRGRFRVAETSQDPSRAELRRRN